MTAQKPLAIAHRGAHDKYPENSLPAILAALEKGADGIEIDVHLTADARLVVHHDAELADGRAIAKLSSYEFASIELAPHVPVPMLEEVLEAVAGKAILFIETKVEGAEFALLRTIRSSSAETAIHSFHHATIRNVKLTMPAVRAGILTSGAGAGAIAAARSANADDIWHEAKDVDATIVIEAHRLGKNVIAWTSNSAKQCARLTELGVDGICTDHLSLLSAAPR